LESEPPNLVYFYLLWGALLCIATVIYLLLSALSYAVSSLEGVDEEGCSSYKESDIKGALLIFSLFVKLGVLFALFKLGAAPILSVAVAIVAIYSINSYSSMLVKGREKRLLKRMKYLILLLVAVTTPLNRLLEWLTSYFREEESQVMEKIVEEEESMEQSGEENTLLKNLLLFNSTTVEKIMVPRVEVVALDYALTTEQVRSRTLQSGFSRMPVYESHLDNIKGFLYIKDLIPLLNGVEVSDHWRRYIREAYFVPGNKKIGHLLEEFREKKIHLAVVVDEWGGTRGIVTLEDVVEEIVGEISDESDMATDGNILL